MRFRNPDGCSCSGCGMTRSTMVSPSGDLDQPLIAFVRGMPSLEETSDPYGRGGKILRQILSSLDFDLSRIMYTYACSCHSKKKDMPRKKDAHACSTRLFREMERAKPKVIVPLGRGGLLATNPDVNISRARGIYRKYFSHTVIPTIDPDELYAQPDSAKDLIRNLTFITEVIRGKTEPVIPLPTESYEFIEDQKGFNDFLGQMTVIKPKETAVDLETSGLDPHKDFIFSIALTIREGHAYIIDWVRLIKNNPSNKVKLEKFLQETECIYQNGMFDHLFLQANDVYPNFVYDTMLESYSLDERQGVHSLKRIAQDYYHPPEYEKQLEKTVRGRRFFVVDASVPPFTENDWRDPIARKAIADYNGADSDLTFRFHQDAKRMMREDHVEHLPERILVPAAKHFIRLKQDGILIDIDYMESLGKQWGEELQELEEEIKKIPEAKHINLNSTQQVKDCIFNSLGLKPMSGDPNRSLDQDSVLEEIAAIEDPEAIEYWKTASAAVFTHMKPESTSMFMLYWLADQHPFPRYLVKHRLASKKKGTYYDGWKKLIDDTHHLRPDYKLHGTRTGRLSSENPNIHGTPRINDLKRMIIAEKGFSFIAADYSQAEVRMMAHFAKDERLIRALHDMDIHRSISIELFGMTDEEMSALPKEEQKLRRRAAKTIVFGLMYGRGVKSLATQMGVEQEEAQTFVTKFFRMMPKVNSWIKKQHAKVIRENEVVSLYGRKRRFPFIPDEKIAAKVKRQAINFPIQSSVSDMTLLANIDIIHELDKRKIPVKVGCHIHDGFMFQVPTGHIEEAIDLTRQRMNAVGFDTEVPFKMDIEIGQTWGDLKPI